MPADRSDIILNSGLFDPDWYGRRHPEAAALDLSPLAHFQSIGWRLGCGVSARHPRLSDLPRLRRALGRQPVVSYCIPVLNRSQDLMSTLPENIEANRRFQDKVEFLVAVFDADDSLAGWIRDTFASELTSGYLRLIRSERLAGWHFGKAKNAFRRYMAGQVYSSLDADNFVTAGETEQLLQVIGQSGPMILFHHFAGVWGDGTSGRVSLSAALYRRIGYDPHFLPRQFDEVDLILSTLRAVPDLPLLHHDTPEHVLETDNIRALLRNAGISPVRACLPMPPRHGARNPKPADYVSTDPLTRAMQGYNEAACYVKNLPDGPPRRAWLERQRGHARAYVAALDLPDLLQALFGAANPALPAHGPVGLVSLTPDRPDPPVAALERLRNGNLSALCLIDGRDSPAPALPATDGVFVLRPQAGHPQTAPDLWEGALRRALDARSLRVDSCG